MSRARIAITLDTESLAELDRLVARGVYANRSRAIQDAVDARLARMARRRLATECTKLDPVFERALAEEGLTASAGQWPEY